MKLCHAWIVIVGFVLVGCISAGEHLFVDPLGPQIDPAWRWVHPAPEAWKSDARGLHLRALPGTLWGKENSGRNQLIRAAPPGEWSGEVTLLMDIVDPLRWEQAGLLWYIDDDHFIKLVKEIENGRWNVVMGREWAGRTTVLCVTPVDEGPLKLRLEVRGGKVIGRYQVGAGPWRAAAECDLPDAKNPHLGLHAQRGPATAEHWVTFQNLVIDKIDKPASGADTP